MSQDKPTRSWLEITEELTVENFGPKFNELVEELKRAMQDEECQSRIVAEPNTTHI
jgi:hypothetical protein